jgi:arylformamidase
MSVIFHITTPKAWDFAKSQSSYMDESLSNSGFIHASLPEQIIAVAHAFYYDTSDQLIILAIDTDQLKSEVRYELGIPGEVELFPHIYGPINIDAVIATAPLNREIGGIFLFPDPLREYLSGRDSTENNKRYVDLSHSVEDGMITYKGLPAPIICDYLSRAQSRTMYAEGTEFYIGKIEMIANTGTYIDSPFHRFADGHDLSELDLSKLADLDAVVIRATHIRSKEIPASLFHSAKVDGKAVLVHTGWDLHWRTEQYFEGHTFLTEEAAIYLRDNGATIVGIDSYNIDDINDGRRPVHTTLLKAGIPIIEHMCNLASLPAVGFRFSAVPTKIKGMGTFPVRAYAILNG